MKPAAIHLHIERVVLDGLDVERRAAPHVQAALEAELGRLLAKGGLQPDLAAGGAVPSLRGGTLEAASGGAPDALGASIAQAVYGGIGGALADPHAPHGGAGGRP